MDEAGSDKADDQPGPRHERIGKGTRPGHRKNLGSQ